MTVDSFMNIKHNQPKKFEIYNTGLNNQFQYQVKQIIICKNWFWLLQCPKSNYISNDQNLMVESWVKFNILKQIRNIIKATGLSICNALDKGKQIRLPRIYTFMKLRQKVKKVSSSLIFLAVLSIFFHSLQLKTYSRFLSISRSDAWHVDLANTQVWWMENSTLLIPEIVNIDTISTYNPTS